MSEPKKEEPTVFDRLEKHAVHILALAAGGPRSVGPGLRQAADEVRAISTAFEARLELEWESGSRTGRKNGYVTAARDIEELAVTAFRDQKDAEATCLRAIALELREKAKGLA